MVRFIDLILLMKNSFTLILLIFLAFVINTNCKKTTQPLSSLERLPPITQEGKNTFGFLLNGQPWTPAGNNGTANLSVYVDANYKQGTFNITAYRIIGQENRQSIGLGIADSLNFQPIPTALILGKQTLSGVSFISNKCTYDFFDDTTYKYGELKLSKLDKTNRIIAGTFIATFYKTDCGDTIKITDGRFDMRY